MDDALAALVKHVPNVASVVTDPTGRNANHHKDVIITVEIEGASEEHIRGWFNETPKVIDGYGFPNGTLLYFSEDESTPSAAHECECGGGPVGKCYTDCNEVVR